VIIAWNHVSESNLCLALFIVSGDSEGIEQFLFDTGCDVIISDDPERVHSFMDDFNIPNGLVIDTEMPTEGSTVNKHGETTPSIKLFCAFGETSDGYTEHMYRERLVTCDVKDHRQCARFALEFLLEKKHLLAPRKS
jgi:hypothetical protein